MIGWIASALEAPLVIVEPFQRLEAIVVLGAPLAPGDRLSRVLEERVAAAAALWQQGGAPVVIATGGVTNGATRAEADVIAEALRARGVGDVIVERSSRTTDENARMAAAVTTARRVWLVTQPFHGRRAARTFRRAGFEPHVWHIADSLEYRERGRATRWLVREYAAWAKQLAKELDDALLRPKR